MDHLRPFTWRCFANIVARIFSHVVVGKGTPTRDACNLSKCAAIFGDGVRFLPVFAAQPASCQSLICASCFGERGSAANAITCASNLGEHFPFLETLILARVSGDNALPFFATLDSYFFLRLLRAARALAMCDFGCRRSGNLPGWSM